MEKSNFWYFTLCALLVIASVNGWSLSISVAIVANALVVVMNILKCWKEVKDE